MSKRDSYAVRISGLGEGDHDFSFELDRKFFALFEQSEIRNGNVHGRGDPGKESRESLLSIFHLKGEVEVVCDRCLENFMTDVSHHADHFCKDWGNRREKLRMMF